jgi:hypothetical protein
MTVMTVVLGVSIVMAQSGKHPANPWAGMTAAQKQATVDQTHAQNVKYLQDFEARHGDPGSLPVIKIASYQGSPATLGAAAAQASVIVRGVVQEVHFSADPQGNIPQMTATVHVQAVGKGSVATPTIVVKQIGGPVAQPGGRGALVRLDEEELILSGDEVVLFVNREQSDGNEYRAVLGAGIFFVRIAQLAGEAAARYGLEGQHLPIAWAALTDPQIPTTAFPLREGAPG